VAAKRRQPRRTQEQRRRETRERILAATLEVLSRDGHTRFTTTHVAATAGVSRGAQENYYPTKTALLAAATAHAMDRAAEQAASSAASASRSDDAIAAFVDDASAFFLSRTYVAMEELALAGRDDPALSKIHADAFRKFRKVHDRIWIDALVRAGYRAAEARSFVEMTIYLLRGLALTALILPGRQPTRDLLARWQTVGTAALGRRTKK
jgi:AcrR family transcriptional regulator